MLQRGHLFQGKAEFFLPGGVPVLMSIFLQPCFQFFQLPGGSFQLCLLEQPVDDAQHRPRQQQEQTHYGQDGLGLVLFPLGFRLLFRLFRLSVGGTESGLLGLSGGLSALLGRVLKGVLLGNGFFLAVAVGLGRFLRLAVRRLPRVRGASGFHLLGGRL